ncbi:Hypothetical predicted protein [Podarcis lilfordi]|uniref:Uncharacterized protein n=1 Tax=Podarcis lilfordi TaxID=74358 RepID=A0AA35NS93_9SAUR|nr:Hypothetical predicted protein [Podarcis lilfordi]
MLHSTLLVQYTGKAIYQALSSRTQEQESLETWSCPEFALLHPQEPLSSTPSPPTASSMQNTNPLRMMIA